MGKKLTPKTVDGIACYSANVADDYADYPDEGFALTDDYAETSFWVQSRNRLFSWLVHHERDRLGQARLLDVGCGTGDFVQHLATDGSLQITGSEIYLRGLQLARKRQPHVDFIQYDVTGGVLDRTYDIITAFDVFEHIEADVTGFENVHDMLCPDGVLIVSVPQHMFLWSTLDDIVCHKRRYSRREMVRKLQDSGFTPVRVTSHVFTLFPLMALSRLLDRAKQARGALPDSGPDTGADTDGQALADRVTFPAGVNWLFNKIMHVDEWLIRRGVSLPFGGTLVVVAHKTAP